MSAVVIGITCDLANGRYTCAPAYANAVARAGGVPILLPCENKSIEAVLHQCDGFVFTGGDDPTMEPFGVATHPKATPIDPKRQSFEVGLLRALEDTDHPILAVCLGMQLMSLVASGTLNQFLPDTHDTASDHAEGNEHLITGELGTGSVHSHHRQAVDTPGRLEIIAQAPDGVIEAVRDPEKRQRIGVQWHPERTTNSPFGQGLFDQLLDDVASKKPRPSEYSS